MNIDTVTLRNKGNFVVGFEAEGKLRKLKTLFVCNSDKESNRKILKVLKELKNIKQVYLGAGNTYVKNFNKVLRLRKKIDTSITITCEVLLTNETKIKFIPRVRYVITNPKIDIAIKKIDLQKEKVSVFEATKNKVYKTRFSDPLFSKDKVIYV